MRDFYNFQHDIQIHAAHHRSVFAAIPIFSRREALKHDRQDMKVNRPVLMGGTDGPSTRIYSRRRLNSAERSVNG